MFIKVQHFVVILLTLSLYQLSEETPVDDLCVSFNHSQNNTTRILSTVESRVDFLNITFANDLNIDRCLSIFYHLKHNRVQPLSVPVKLRQGHRFLVLLLISGDVSVNPGPSKQPCGSNACHTTVAKTHRAVLCEACLYWWHIKCADITLNEYKALSNSEDPWLCKTCQTFQFSESFYDNNSTVSYDHDTSLNNLNETLPSVFDEIKNVRNNHTYKFMVSHLNINSLKSKFVEIHELLNDKIVDLFFISETKLDPTFRDSLFEVSGYKMERKDRNIHGGGIVSYIRSDIPSRRRADLEMNNLESIVYEVILNKTKWCIICIYRPPSMSNNDFSQNFIKCIDRCMTFYDNYIVIGDLNYDLLCENKGKTLFDLMELFDLQN